MKGTHGKACTHPLVLMSCASIASPLSPPLLQDIGVFLRDVFRKRFKGVDIKYIGGCSVA